MKQVFVDTSGWDALADKADKDHARALQFRDGIAEVFAFDHHFEQMGFILLPSDQYPIPNDK